MRNGKYFIATTYALTLVVVVCVAKPGLADDSSHRAAAEAYLETTQTGAKMAEFLAQIKRRHLAEIDKWYVPEAKQDEAVDYVEQVSEIVNRELSWGGLKDDFVAAYMQVFTQAELQRLVEFYRTPIGQSYLSKRGQLMTIGVDLA